METHSNSTLTALEAPSPLICPHVGLCGGCAHQDKSYPDQLRNKEEKVRQALAGLPVHEMLPIESSPESFFYRNKMEYSFGDEFDRRVLKLSPDPGRVHVGLHPKGRFSLTAPTPDCRLLSEDAKRIVNNVSEWATENAVPVYVRPKNKGVLRHLIIREGKNTGERLVVLVATSQLPNIGDLAKRLKDSHVPISSFLWARHDGLSDVARGSHHETFWGEGWIHERLGRVEFRVTPYSFMQTNTHAAEKMVDILREWTDEIPTQDRRALCDLYCGAGTIGLNLADLFENVVGIESEQQSVENARETARRNYIGNAEFEVGRVENLVDRLSQATESSICVVDPPRAGLHPKVTEALLSSPFRRIFYVSCNPETLARDLKVLAVKYGIDVVQPIDFFPHTDHVETLVKLQVQNG